MGILHSSKAYVFNLRTTSSAEAKRLWRRDIKEKWNWQCAYCGDKDNLTIESEKIRDSYFMMPTNKNIQKLINFQ